MTVSLLPARPADAVLMRNLFQFYAYDFAEILGGNVRPDGTFQTPPLESYWQDSWKHPFVLHVEGNPAGFALVHERSRITGDAGVWDVAEFFVMRPHRRRGVGSRAAVELFDRFRGRWEVRQVGANQSATSFWRATIERYTGGRFAEAIYDDERWRGPVQTFDSARS